MTMTTDISLLPAAEIVPRDPAPEIKPFGPLASILLVLAIMAFSILIALAVGFTVTGMVHEGGWDDFLSKIEAAEGGGLSLLDERISWIATAVWSLLLIPFVIAIAAIRDRSGVGRLLALNFELPLKPMLWALGLIILVGLAEGWIAEMNPTLKQLFALPEDALSLAFAALAIMVLAPIGEELVFRGFLYTAFRERWGYAPSLIIVSVLFSAMHFEPTMMYPLLVLPLAFVLGWLREKSGGVFAPMLLHMAVNDWAFVANLLTR